MTEYANLNYYKRVMARHSELVDERRIWDAQRQVIVEYYRPDITIYSSKDSAKDGSFLHEAIVEGTGNWAAGVMARGFHSALVGPSINWRESHMEETKWDGDDQINAFLERFDNYLIKQVYAQSNFYEVIGNDVLDGITVGSPVVLIEENVAKGVIEFKLPHYQENYLKRDWFGRDILYHRQFELSALTAMQKFGKENLPQDVQRQLERGEHFAKSKYLQVIYSKGDPIFDDLPKETPTFSDEAQKTRLNYHPVVNRAWVSHHFAMGVTDVRLQGHLPERNYGYNYNNQPFAAWHYFRNPGETYARTPAWSAIYDEKSGQAAWTTMFEAAEQAARPAMIGLKQMKRRTRTGPGKWTWAQDEAEYNMPPKAVHEGINYPHAMDFVDRIDDKRKRHFNVDLFRLIDEYSREHDQPPTAYQISQMIAEKNAQVGPAIVSFDRGLLKPVDDLVIEIEDRSGRLFSQTDPPDIIWETNLRTVPKFTGPLAKAQNTAIIMKETIEPLAVLQPLFDMFPDAKYKIDEGDLVEHFLEQIGFRQQSIVAKEVYDDIKQSLNMSRARSAELEQASMAADISQKLGKGAEEGSPLKQLTGAA
ncbi:MAG: hypothetical protein E3J26_02255 [Candidatus Zixiibacteriota bacterium]|nr:MAG: hypothetical protein E3J26_02255 [candidate division Zixibacteria bacterium]